MQARAFIGLFFLFAALLVVATPQLLAQTASGVDHLLTLAGAPPAELVAADERERELAKLEDGNAIVPESRRRGWEDLDGDLVRTFEPGEIAESGEFTRMPTGSKRVLLPGQKAGAGPETAPPRFDAAGVLLDQFGCPLVPDEMDMRSALQDAAVEKLYTGKVQAAVAAGNTACPADWNKRVRESSLLPAEDDVEPAADTRRSTSLQRRGAVGTLIGEHRVTLLELVLGTGVTETETAEE